MTLQEALRLGRHLLAPISDEASLETELLLAHVLKTDRVHLYQRLQDPLSPRKETAFRALLARRQDREPTPYIVGRKEFYGLELLVTAAAIVPRPETELLVELAMAEARRILERKGSVSIVDVGAGCGAIACAIAANLPRAEVTATDVSARALALAQRNAQRLGLAQRLRFLRGNLLEPLTGPVDVIAANLPYVRSPDWEQLPSEIHDHEPRRGLDGGADGLRTIRRLLRQAPPYLDPGGALVLEIGDDQGAAVQALARAAFSTAHIEVRRDLAGLDRVLLVRVA